MDSALYDELQRTLSEAGPTDAIDSLCTSLRERKDYAGLFYALLMKKRYELGVCPVPTGSSQDLPDTVHQEYENGIREAGRLVGQLYLDDGDIPHAWIYYRMLSEPGPVATALDRVQPGEGEDVQQLVDIAYHQGIHPRKGFDLVLERFGICSAITMAGGGQELGHPPEVRDYCTQRLVRALYRELAERLKADIVRREGSAPATQSVKELMAGRDWLFEDEFYHIDVSHLSSVVQMSMQLLPGEEMNLARELCAYGSRLSPRFQNPGEPPFENLYRDYGVYLAILAGDGVEEGLSHFRAKVENADPEASGTLPAEVLVNLLVRLGRLEEALAVSRRHLAGIDTRRLSCPSLTELCVRTGDYRTLVDVAREQSDPVHFVAGLLAVSQQPS